MPKNGAEPIMSFRLSANRVLIRFSACFKSRLLLNKEEVDLFKLGDQAHFQCSLKSVFRKFTFVFLSLRDFSKS